MKNPDLVNQEMVEKSHLKFIHFISVFISFHGMKLSLQLTQSLQKYD